MRRGRKCSFFFFSFCPLLGFLGIRLKLCVMALCDDLGGRSGWFCPKRGLYTQGTLLYSLFFFFFHPLNWASRLVNSSGIGVALAPAPAELLRLCSELRPEFRIPWRTALGMVTVEGWTPSWFGAAVCDLYTGAMYDS